MSLSLPLKTAFIALVGLFLVAPTVVVVVISFTSATVLSFPPPGFDTRWYAKFFADQQWYNAAVTSFAVGVLSMTLATVLGTLAAFGLVRGHFPGRPAVVALILSPLIVPSVVVALGLYIFYVRIGLAGPLPSLVLAHGALGFPFVVVNVAASLRTLDETVELAARGLGAGPLYTFFRITLPLILPGVVAGALFAFITSWDEVVVALFLSTPLLQTLPVVIWAQIKSDVDPTVAAASTLVSALSLLVLCSWLVIRSRAAAPGGTRA
jgi:putative spermidine/putrescine transport system permease protein